MTDLPASAPATPPNPHPPQPILKGRGLLALLVAALLLCAIGTVVLSLQFTWTLRNLQIQQRNAAIANDRKALIQALVLDAHEYSKTNPAILPILKAAGSYQRNHLAPTPTNPTQPNPSR